MFPEELLNGLWHTTSRYRLEKILECGYISSLPDIPDSERWGTAMGAEYYPFTRHIGGISLFDFENFESEKYSEQYPASSWTSFVPHSSNV